MLDANRLVICLTHWHSLNILDFVRIFGFKSQYRARLRQTDAAQRVITAPLGRAIVVWSALFPES